MIVDIEDLHNTKQGRVALLGSGESVEDINLQMVDKEMDIIGLNQHWRARDTPPWRCAVDPNSYQDILSKEAPIPELLISPLPKVGNTLEGQFLLPASIQGLNLCPVWHIPQWIKYPRQAHPYCGDFQGFELDKGSYAPYTGLFALEIAIWAGYTDIRLLGYDCLGGHFFNPRFVNHTTTHEYWAHLLGIAAETIGDRAKITNCSPISTITAFPKGPIL